MVSFLAYFKDVLLEILLCFSAGIEMGGKSDKLTPKVWFCESYE